MKDEVLRGDSHIKVRDSEKSGETMRLAGTSAYR